MIHWDNEALTLSVIVPCYNEEAVLPDTHLRLVDVLEQLEDLDFEIIYVDDGSQDATPKILRQMQAADKRVRVVRFSRNFGHQLAITAGVEHASGGAIVVMDADLQDPPEVIPEMVAQWRNGYDVAYGVRIDRAGETAFRLSMAKAFYRVLNRLSKVQIPLDTGDFRLMSRKAVDSLRAMPERDRFLRGMVSWVGFRQVAVPYKRAPRIAGTTKYPLSKLLHLALDGIFSFSTVPLRLATWVGLAAAGLALAGIVSALVFRLLTGVWASGSTLLLIAVLFVGGAQLLSLGILGEYIGRIYGEAKRRPLYVVEERLGFKACKEESDLREG